MSSVILLPLALVSTNPTTNDGTENGANIALKQIYRTKWFQKTVLSLRDQKLLTEILTQDEQLIKAILQMEI
ncbi:hypothetical protein ONA00_01805 [Mycoplasmopsis cynos]|uniref:hypothetical protein n=1 Tax=Mycoplasmopsis cynos TaxID=171284 RepID=UPI0024C7E731|nr:hypothetical protein [Mycoplasmopsis cynos]WAM11212.1 hypothetical protein ONA00_01805 [Mycoplasmopsis cynos]